MPFSQNFRGAFGAASDFEIYKASQLPRFLLSGRIRKNLRVRVHFLIRKTFQSLDPVSQYCRELSSFFKKSLLENLKKSLPVFRKILPYTPRESFRKQAEILSKNPKKFKQHHFWYFDKCPTSNFRKLIRDTTPRRQNSNRSLIYVYIKHFERRR